MQQSYACDCETSCKDTVVKAKVLANEAKTLKLNLHIVMELFNEERQQEILE